LDRNEFKRSESKFDTNKTIPFLSISIHFRLLGIYYKWFILLHFLSSYYLFILLLQLYNT